MSFRRRALMGAKRKMIWNQKVSNSTFATLYGVHSLRGSNSISQDGLLFTSTDTTHGTCLFYENSITNNYSHKYFLHCLIRQNMEAPTGKQLETYYSYYDSSYNNSYLALTYNQWIAHDYISSQVITNDKLCVSFTSNPWMVMSGFSFNIKEFVCVDLTQAFGEGNEPTSMNDARMVFIKNYVHDHPEYNAGEEIEY